MKGMMCVCLALLLGLCVSGVKSVFSVQEHNYLTSEVHRLKVEHEQLVSDWSALLLEYRLLLSDKQLEQAIGNGLDLEIPASRQMVYLDYYELSAN